MGAQQGSASNGSPMLSLRKFTFLREKLRQRLNSEHEGGALPRRWSFGDFERAESVPNSGAGFGGQQQQARSPPSRNGLEAPASATFISFHTQGNARSFFTDGAEYDHHSSNGMDGGCQPPRWQSEPLSNQDTTNNNGGMMAPSFARDSYFIGNNGGCDNNAALMHELRRDGSIVSQELAAAVTDLRVGSPQMQSSTTGFAHRLSMSSANSSSGAYTSPLSAHQQQPRGAHGAYGLPAPAHQQDSHGAASQSQVRIYAYARVLVLVCATHSRGRCLCMRARMAYTRVLVLACASASARAVPVHVRARMCVKYALASTPARQQHCELGLACEQHTSLLTLAFAPLSRNRPLLSTHPF